jgi:DNA-binding LytR/AlgR family response regulator
VTERLRVIIADDERPARSFLAALLRSFDDVTIVGEAASGKEAVALIERERPDLELRLDPAKFIRLGRGTLANLDLISKIGIMPGGGHVAVLNNGQKLPVSRIQSRSIRERLLKL